jgi:prepilin peptidase dependent protein B
MLEAVIVCPGPMPAQSVRPGGMRFGARRALHGLTLVEVLVGLAIGSLILAAALTHVVAQLTGLQQLTEIARTEHELRLVVAHMARQLRSAGHRPHDGAHEAGRPGGAPTPGRSSSPAAWAYADAPDALVIAPGRVEFSRVDWHHATGPRQQSLGFRLHNGTLQARVAGSSPWQSLTDPATLQVTGLQLHLVEDSDVLAGVCHAACPRVVDPCAPGRASRTVAIELSFHDPREPGVPRSIRQLTRLRNDLMEVTCAAA